MDLIFWFKGENGKVEYEGVYSFEEEEEGLTKLKNDFDRYCEGVHFIKGGSYKCKYDGNDTILLLKFDEIVFIRYGKNNKKTTFPNF